MNLNDWPKPKLNAEFFQNKHKMYLVMYCLHDMGYNINSAREIIDTIEHENLDKSKFDFPYETFDLFKEHVLAGEFDVNVEKRLTTPEQIAAYKQDTKDRHLWERS